MKNKRDWKFYSDRRKRLDKEAEEKVKEIKGESNPRMWGGLSPDKFAKEVNNMLNGE